MFVLGRKRRTHLLLLLAHTVQNFNLKPPSASDGACTAGATTTTAPSEFVLPIPSGAGGGGGGGGTGSWVGGCRLLPTGGGRRLGSSDAAIVVA
jgi:hypothetical protein